MTNLMQLLLYVRYNTKSESYNVKHMIFTHERFFDLNN